MSKTEKLFSTLIVIVVIVILCLTGFFSCTPTGKAMWNNWFYDVQKVDDATNYKTKKKVEDTCRAMIASYESDKLTYEQYKDSDNEEKLSWAEQAKMRTNKTASTYNNYILEKLSIDKNKYLQKCKEQIGNNIQISEQELLQMPMFIDGTISVPTSYQEDVQKGISYKKGIVIDNIEELKTQE